MKAATLPGLCALLLTASALAQDSERYNGPIIYMHLHGGHEAGKFRTEPDGTPLRRFCFPEPCFHSPARVQKASDIRPMTLEAMKKHNIVLGVLSDQPPGIFEWRTADPDRFLLGYFMHPSEVGLSEFREQFQSGKFQVLGELAFQYDDIAIDEPLLEPMFEMAEELDIPLHSIPRYPDNDPDVIAETESARQEALERYDALREEVERWLQRHPWPTGSH